MGFTFYDLATCEHVMLNIHVEIKPPGKYLQVMTRVVLPRYDSADEVEINNTYGVFRYLHHYGDPAAKQVIESTMSESTHERTSHPRRCSIHVKIPKPEEETFVDLVVKALQET